MRLSKIKEGFMTYWKDTDKHYVGEWVAIGIVLLFCLLTMNYTDLVSANQDTYLFLNYIFSGKVLRVREILLACPYGVSFFCAYGIGFFPIWIIGQFGLGYDICESLGCLIWMKLFLAIVSAGMMIQVRRIAYIIGIRKENIKWLLFAIASSLFVVLPVFQIGQYDIIALFFIVLGIRLYLEGKMKWFVLAFAFAIPMKFFAAFVFIPMVLYHTKKIWKILLLWLSGASIYLFERIIIGNVFLKLADILQVSVNHGESIILASGELTGGMIADNVENVSSYGDQFVSGQLGYLMENEFTFGNAVMSCFFLAFAAVCVWAFLKKRAGSREEMGRDVITLGFMTYAGFFLTFYSWNSYWIVLIAPFLLLYVFMHESNLRTNLIFETIITFGVIIGKMIHQSWVFGGQDSFSNMILGGFQPRLMNVFYLIEKYKIAKYYPVIIAITVVCLVALFVINRKRKTVTTVFEKTLDEEVDNTRVSRGLWWFRIAILYLFVFAMLYLNFWNR